MRLSSSSRDYRKGSSQILAFLNFPLLEMCKWLLPPTRPCRCDELDGERRNTDRRLLALDAELACERRLTAELATDLAGRLRELFAQLPGPPRPPSLAASHAPILAACICPHHPSGAAAARPRHEA
jgi:hypothetical protein